jgi:hypothetical protein
MNHESMRAAIAPLRHSPIRNYVIPGLTSWLIGQPSPAGTMRLFENSRDHQENITPHSHRFDFRCWVLKGSVRNKLWKYAAYQGDWFTKTTLHYLGQTGAYERGGTEGARYTCEVTEYAAGDWYGMKAHEIHSIVFAAGTEVLFIEGPSIKDRSVILEPFVDGELIPTFEVKPWMFKRDAAPGVAPTQGGEQ